jgi:hypothetical protein
VSVWVSRPLLPCPVPDHRAGWCEPPCAWRWPPDLWDVLIGEYALPGDRVLVSDAGSGTPAVRAALAHGCSIAARLPSRVQRIGVRLDLLDGTSWADRRRVVLFGGSSGSRFAVHSGGYRTDPASGPRSGGAPLQSEGWPARVRRVPADLFVIVPPCPGETPVGRPWTWAGEGRHAAARIRSGPTPGSLRPCGHRPGPDPAARSHPVDRLDQLDSVDPVDPVVGWQQQLIADSLRLVRPGGVVAVLTRNTAHTRGMVDRLGPLIVHAQRLGLAYLQHVPIVHAVIDRDRLVPDVGADDRARHPALTDLTHPAGYQTWTRLAVDRHPPPPGTPPQRLGPVGDPLPHMPVHTDLLVFTTPLARSAVPHVSGLEHGPVVSLGAAA